MFRSVFRILRPILSFGFSICNSQFVLCCVFSFSMAPEVSHCGHRYVHLFCRFLGDTPRLSSCVLFASGLLFVWSFRLFVLVQNCFRLLNRQANCLWLDKIPIVGQKRAPTWRCGLLPTDMCFAMLRIIYTLWFILKMMNYLFNLVDLGTSLYINGPNFN